MQEVANDIDTQVQHYLDSSKLRPTIPVTGFTNNLEGLQPHVRVVERNWSSAPGVVSLFGRVPIDILSARLKASFDVDPKSEYLDLGTPLTGAHSATTADLGNCKALMGILSHNDPARLAVQVVLVDRGDLVIGARPDDFNGRVRHLVPQDVVFSSHAANVFETMLRRLRSHGVIDEVEFLCALVPPPAKPIGRQCFEHANVVELQSALVALSTQVATSKKPVVTNISMGTHVGPHVGNTPMETDLEQSMPFQDQRYLVCSAGNDGLHGLSASHLLNAGVREYFRLRTSPKGCRELLLELWWWEQGAGSLQATVEVTDANGRQRGTPVQLASHNPGASMKTAGPGFQGVVCESLYQANCPGDLHCIAFALSTSNAIELADLTIDIGLLSPVGGLSVFGWIVLPRDQRCSFVGGGFEGSVTMPATMPNAVSVAGVDGGGQPWKNSSRGWSQGWGHPRLAHLAAFGAGGLEGTSFAAPRVAADVAERILRSVATPQNGNRLATFATADDLVQALLQKYRGGHSTTNWNARTGHGSIVQGP